MPELPEVETIRTQLERELRNKNITRITIRLPKMVRGRVSSFRKKVTGKKIIAVRRRGKYLLWELDSGYTIVLHLKMTGQLVHQKKKTMRVGGHPIPGGTQGLPNKYSHVIFHLSDGGTVYFNDQRQFGFVEVIRTDDQRAYFAERRMGPEPLESHFTLAYFQDLLKRRPTAPIKQVLLDQTAIAGIGNIYALEALFRAGIRPQRRTKRVTRAEAKKLHYAIKTILRRAVTAQGSSADNYVDAYGAPGKYVPKLRVYGRGGERCYACGSTITRITLGGRGTTYCPQCQR